MIICVLFYRLGFCIVTSSKDRGSSSEVVLKFLQNLWKNTCGGLSLQNYSLETCNLIETATPVQVF